MRTLRIISSSVPSASAVARSGFRPGDGLRGRGISLRGVCSQERRNPSNGCGRRVRDGSTSGLQRSLAADQADLRRRNCRRTQARGVPRDTIPPGASRTLRSTPARQYNESSGSSASRIANKHRLSGFGSAIKRSARSRALTSTRTTLTSRPASRSISPAAADATPRGGRYLPLTGTSSGPRLTARNASRRTCFRHVGLRRRALNQRSP